RDAPDPDPQPPVRLRPAPVPVDALDGEPPAGAGAVPLVRRDSGAAVRRAPVRCVRMDRLEPPRATDRPPAAGVYLPVRDPVRVLPVQGDPRTARRELGARLLRRGLAARRGLVRPGPRVAPLAAADRPV